MNTIPVESVEDPRLSAYRNLPTRKTNPAPDLFVVEGRLLVERLLNSDFEVESILMDERRESQLNHLLPDSLPVYTAPLAVLESILGFTFHQGMIACGRRKQVDFALSDLLRDNQPFLAVACINIQDSENLGGIFRNCAAFGVDLILVDDHCVDPYSRRVLRVSMGAAFEVANLTDQGTAIRT